MKCPSCAHADTRVVDSRLTKDGAIIRRRRECESCGHRFTTFERIEESLPMVVKKDDRRESFDRNKILAGLKRACEKRPISIETLEEVLDGLEKTLQERSEKEVDSAVIGELVMEELKKLDQVAYVRFASVYRSFKDINEFMTELKGLLDKKG